MELQNYGGLLQWYQFVSDLETNHIYCDHVFESDTVGLTVHCCCWVQRKYNDLI